MNYEDLYFLLFEKKDHLIKKISSLTDEQQNTIIAFFKKKNALESKINWNKLDKLSWADFEPLMKGSVKIKSGKAKNGKDFIEIDAIDKYNKAFIPLSWEGAKYLASNAVGGEEGKWCIAYEKMSGYWADYTKRSIFIIYVTPTTKFALEIDRNQLTTNAVWDREDISFMPSKFREKVGVDFRATSLTSKNKKALVKAVELTTPEYPFTPDDNAVFEVNFDTDRIHWKSGTWENGDWKDGTWKDGTWKDGTWENGTWEDGIWEKGIWRGGTWKDGIWKFGLWKTGTWEGGTWEGGTWEWGIWKKGIWKTGTWESGKWEKGLIYDQGKIVESDVSPREYFANKNK